MSRESPPTSQGFDESDPFVRWGALPPRDRSGARSNTYDDRVGALIRQSLPPVGLEQAALNRVQRRLHERRTFSFKLWPRTRWAVLALSIVLVSSGVVAGTALLRVNARHVKVARVGMQIPAVKASRVRERSRSSVALALPQEAVPNVPVPTLKAKAHEASFKVRTVRAPLVVPGLPNTEAAAPIQEGPPQAAQNAEVVPSALAQESALLAQALATLRHDPQAALLLLDQHGKRFSGGALVPEALRMRVDALLMANKVAAAESVLRSMTLSYAGRDLELRVILAELTARHDCQQALAMFTKVIESHPGSGLYERALWGRAACHSQVSDEPSAAKDLSAYLQRFPEGSHAAAARQRLHQ